MRHAEGPAAAATRGAWLRVGLAAGLTAKLLLLGVWYQGAPSARAAGDGKAPAAAARDESGSPEVRGLLQSLRERQADLDAREQALARQEQRLELFERDVTAKLTELEAIEARLGSVSQAEQAAVGEAAQSLAKIYATMKPADAAPILDQLDEATVLAIFGAMKEKEVGLILPLMSRDRAIALTRSLATQR